MEIEIIFLFKAIIVICTSKLCISLIKKALNIPRQQESTTNGWDKFLFYYLCIGAPMTCLMLTAFADLRIKIYFAIWMLIVLLICFLIKKSSIRFQMMILSSIVYGLVLAKWYLLNPLKRRFGDNGIEESIAILLSAVMVMLPIHMIDSRETQKE